MLDDSLWRLLVHRRFRVSSRVARSRRLLAAGGVSWRLLYQQWHSSARMPTSKLSGSQYPSFAKGRLRRHDTAALVWVTVVSTDDCRLVAGFIRLRVVLQNVAGGTPMSFDATRASFALTDDVVIPVRERPPRGNARLSGGSVGVQTRRRRRVVGTAEDKALPFRRSPSPVTPVPDRREYSASLEKVVLGRAGGGELTLDNGDGRQELQKDDFAILTMDVKMPEALFEIDALERLDALHVPVCWGTDAVPLVARFQEKTIWDNYERLPGGWWIRVQASTALA